MHCKLNPQKFSVFNFVSDFVSDFVFDEFYNTFQISMDQLDKDCLSLLIVL